MPLGITFSASTDLDEQEESYGHQCRQSEARISQIGGLRIFCLVHLAALRPYPCST